MRQLKGGVIIIGSLLWDENKIREEWRSKYLDSDKICDVEVPIRYGRLSSSRDSVYTMIFSSELIDSNEFGLGKFAPFKKNPVTFDELILNCEELIKSEHKKEKLNFTSFNWNWGSLAIMFNPRLLNENTETVNYFIDEWKKKINEKFKPSDYILVNEKQILDEKAMLNFNWPKSIDDFDFFITTCNKLTSKQYPSANEISEKFNENGSNYFCKNILNNITTFQDLKIKNNLKDGKI